MNTSLSRVRGRRPLAVVGAAALALSLMPAVAGANSYGSGSYGSGSYDAPSGEEASETPEPETIQESAGTTAVPASRGTARVCPAPEVEGFVPPTFTDVAGTTHEQAIVCATAYGLIGGFGDDTFRPAGSATRGQIATLVAGWLEAARGVELPVPATDAFSDIGGSTHADAINALAAVGIVQGRSDDTFGPSENVSRGQMAALIARAIDVADDGVISESLPAPSVDIFFADVVGSTFQAEIQAIAALGIVQGDGDDYAPNASVTRGQLAAFLMRGADYLDREQRWAPTAEVVTYEVALAGANEIGPDGEPGAGQVDAEGSATLVIDAFNGTLTADLVFDEVNGPFEGSAGVHIHVGGIGENGGVVLFLATADELEASLDGTLSNVIAEDASTFRFAELIEDPDGYYVNLHSVAYPAGAIRGQLPDGGQQLLAPVTYTVTMTGEAEVGNDGATDVGDLGATAEAVIVMDALAGTIDYTVELSDVDGPFDVAPGFHIHVGPAGVNGGIVAFLASGAEVAAADMGDGVLTGTFDAEASVIRRIVADPAGFYLNLHSNAFPPGAVRAQLG